MNRRPSPAAAPRTVLAALLLAAFPAPAAEPFVIGVCTHFQQDKGLLGSNLSMIRQAGVLSIRDEAVWRGVEREKSVFAMPPAWDEYVARASAEDLDPLIILDYGNPFYDQGGKPLSEEAREGFARYSEFVVRRFLGRVRRYEVWNEWDIGIGGTTPGTPESYVALLKKVYPRIKAVDPSITVYAGAMTSGGVDKGWLDGMLAAGALPYLDALSIHSYNYGRKGRLRTPEAWAEWTANAIEAVRRHSGGREVPMVVTEMGWPTHTDARGTDPETAAAYLARLFLLARTMPTLRGLWWYDFQDDGWRHDYNENNFGLVRPDLTPKPAWFALRAISDLVAAGEFVGRADAGDAGIHVLKFRRPDGAGVWALWSAHEDDGWQIALRNGAERPSPVTVQLAGRAPFEREWGARDWVESRAAPPQPDRLEFTVRGTPWLISGDLSRVEIAGVTRREFPEAARPARPAAPGAPQKREN